MAIVTVDLNFDIERPASAGGGQDYAATVFAKAVQARGPWQVQSFAAQLESGGTGSAQIDDSWIATLLGLVNFLEYWQKYPIGVVLEALLPQVEDEFKNKE